MISTTTPPPHTPDPAISSNSKKQDNNNSINQTRGRKKYMTIKLVFLLHLCTLYFTSSLIIIISCSLLHWKWANNFSVISRLGCWWRRRSNLGWEFQFLVPISGTPIVSGILILCLIPKILVRFFFWKSNVWRVRKSEFWFAIFGIPVISVCRNSVRLIIANLYWL